MAQNIQLFGPREGFLTLQWIISGSKKLLAIFESQFSFVVCFLFIRTRAAYRGWRINKKKHTTNEICDSIIASNFVEPLSQVITSDNERETWGGKHG